MALSKTTTDHEEIKRWAEARQAIPSEASNTAKKGQTGVLRFQFPKAPRNNDAALQEISWDEFFQKFDENGLALVYQEKTAAGRPSNFNKLINPDSKASSARLSDTGSVDTDVHPSSGRKKAATTRSNSKKSTAGKSATGKSAPAKKRRAA